MHYALGLPTPTSPDNVIDGDDIAAVAVAAEAAGFGAVFLTEHPIPSDTWLNAGGHNAFDPFVGLAFAAAATTSIRLLTNLTPLPFRNPFLLAKSAASLDRLSGGRLTLGCGTGYLKSEFFALGVDFAERNALFDESLDVLRQVWTGESVTFEGLHFSCRASTALPAPAQGPDLPIWIGGNSKLSRRRVAEGAQGWMPMPNPPSVAAARRTAPLETAAQLAEMLGYMRDHAASVDRTAPIDVMWVAPGTPGGGSWNADQHHTEMAPFADAGVTWLACNPVEGPISAVIEQIERFGAEVISA